MATLPSWMLPYLPGAGAGDVSFGYDSLGRLTANGYAPDATYYNSLQPWQLEDGPSTAPRYDNDGNVMLTGPEGETMGEMRPYWDSAGLMQAIAQQYGAVGARPLQSLQQMYQQSELPGGGVSFDKYVSTMFPGHRIENVPGLGDTLLSNQEVNVDWSPYTSYDENHGLDMVLKDILPAALAMYGTVTGIGGLANAAGIGAGSGGMAGMAEGYGALEASMATPVAAGGAEVAAGALPATTSTFGTAAPFTDGIVNPATQTLGQSLAPGSTLGTAAPFTEGLLPVTSAGAQGALAAYEAAAGAGAPAAPAATTPAAPTSTTPAPTTPTPTSPINPAAAATTAATAATGALGDSVTGVDSLGDANGLTPTDWVSASSSDPLGAVRALLATSGLSGLSSLLPGGQGGSGGIDLGRLIAGGTGVLGSMYAADKYDDLARDTIDLMGGDALKSARRNALSRYEANATSPSAFLEDPWVKAALDQATEARNRTLSRTMPTAGNPAAETEIQKGAIASLFGNLMLPYRQQLANEAGVATGPTQAAQVTSQLGQKAIDASMSGWNSAGYGLSSVLPGSNSSQGNILDLINGMSRISGLIGA